jgi:F0F1-type ATP synthase assembly protein I
MKAEKLIGIWLLWIIVSILAHYITGQDLFQSSVIAGLSIIITNTEK